MTSNECPECGSELKENSCPSCQTVPQEGVGSDATAKEDNCVSFGKVLVFSFAGMAILLVLFFLLFSVAS